MDFNASISSTPPGPIKGAFKATLVPEGIRFNQGKKKEFLLPRATQATPTKPPKSEGPSGSSAVRPSA